MRNDTCDKLLPHSISRDHLEGPVCFRAVLLKDEVHPKPGLRFSFSLLKPVWLAPMPALLIQEVWWKP